jgi:hypothetical protein
MRTAHQARFVAITVALAAAACVEEPSTDASVSVAPASSSIPADGDSLVEIQVTAATDGDVVVTASTGSFVGAPAPSAGAPATTTVKTFRGTTSVTFRAGVDPGTAVITASAGSVTATKTIELTASPPAQIVLTPNRTTVPADGVSYVELTTTLLTGRPPAAVSHGTTIQYGVCCLNATSQPVDCAPGAAPLIIPTLTPLEDAEQIVVRAITVHQTTPASAVLLGRSSNSAILGSLCAPPAAGEVRSNSIAVTVTAP